MSFANIGSIYPPTVGADPCVRPTPVRRTTAGQIIVNMKDLPSYNRHSIRLKGYDYSNAGCYFITVCTQDKISLFGDIQEGEMIENEVGRMVYYWIEKIGTKFQDVQCYDTIVMPNHIHLILTIGCKPELKLQQPLPTLSTVIGQYKSAVSRKIHMINPKITVWQKSFHDRIIRNEAEYLKLWKYIDKNTIPFMFD